jgi:hypothetical protein
LAEALLIARAEQVRPLLEMFHLCNAAAGSHEVRVGDFITRVDSRDVEREPMAVLKDLILGPQGTQVRLSCGVHLQHDKTALPAIIFAVALHRPRPCHALSSMTPALRSR